MPLQPGSSDHIVSENIKKLIEEGYEKKQAIAIAYEQAGRSKQKNQQQKNKYNH